MDLVKLAYEWICESVPDNYRPFVAIDSPESVQSNDVNGFIPDVYYDFNNTMYIGEAKTLKDFDRNHSRQQYDAYLKRCEKYDGDAHLVISVPWQLLNTAKNYFRLYKIKNNCTTQVIIITDMKTTSEI